MVSKELRRYIPIADMIAKTFGEQCEVVIHDLSVPQASVVYAINNHVTGRQVGQSFDHLVKNVLFAKDFANDYKANYLINTADNRKIKSSTVFIRDNKNKIIGAICINYDLKPLQDFDAFLKSFLNVEEEQEIEKEIEPFDHVVEIVDELIDKIIVTTDVDRLKRKEKIELIQFMERKGIFLMKGSIEKVAEKLNISKVTVYSYLDEIKKNKLEEIE